MIDPLPLAVQQRYPDPGTAVRDVAARLSVARDWRDAPQRGQLTAVEGVVLALRRSVVTSGRAGTCLAATVRLLAALTEHDQPGYGILRVRPPRYAPWKRQPVSM
ncbi:MULTISPECIES: hypothetical protein [unclassified Solwaraspora]|uniref:hypothetical protein n=1 Tax=unclassified Solwaraspora TaxID=2627926 RepID=UPI00248C37F9|nr:MULTISPECIES: hypothetical protein [unclassified Solwaraspora]WBC00038.1 hypothetical protein O7553_14680 [Solwaraspora sp. WMMA2059]WBC21416.1 hypothetical protein O7543_02690 [Solwaraspora sp. WMMA2080]WJK36504.1 hypothetical protein O7610_09220 [Solwaraspora sp. WMMA2065]